MRHLLSRSARHGRALAFTLLEVIVGLAVVLILAAVALPSLNGYLDQKAVESTADRMTTITTGLTDFYTGVAKNASRLSALSTTIVKTDAGYLDSCHAQYATKDVTSWGSTGPFVDFIIDRTTGLVTPIGTARDTITRIPLSATAGVQRINFIDGVETRYAELLDSYIDAGNGNASGTVQWNLPAVNGLVVMFYFIPVNNKC